MSGVATAMGDRHGHLAAHPHLGSGKHPDVGVQHALGAPRANLAVRLGQQHGGRGKAEVQIVQVRLLSADHRASLRAATFVEPLIFPNRIFDPIVTRVERSNRGIPPI